MNSFKQNNQPARQTNQQHHHYHLYQQQQSDLIQLALWPSEKDHDKTDWSFAVPDCRWGGWLCEAVMGAWGLSALQPESLSSELGFTASRVGDPGPVM